MLIDERIHRCPECGKPFRHTDLMSYSDFGKSRLRSDGQKMNDRSIQLSFLPFTTCPNCRKLIWTEDTDLIEDLPDSDSIPRSDFPPGHYWPNFALHLIKDCNQLLPKTERIERKLVLHIHIWRFSNDLCKQAAENLKGFRFGKFLKYKSLYKKQIANKKNSMEAALTIIENIQTSDSPYFDKQEELLLKIELLRESRQFKKAKDLLLRNQQVMQSYPEFIRKTKRAIKLRTSGVFYW